MCREGFYWRRSVFSRDLKVVAVALSTVSASRLFHSCHKEGIPEHCSIRLYVSVFELMICTCSEVCWNKDTVYRDSR